MYFVEMETESCGIRLLPHELRHLRQFSFRCELVHQSRQNAGKSNASDRGRNADATGDLLQPVLTNQSLDLLRSDWLVGPTPNPGLHDSTEPL